MSRTRSGMFAAAVVAACTPHDVSVADAPRGLDDAALTNGTIAVSHNDNGGVDQGFAGSEGLFTQLTHNTFPSVYPCYSATGDQLAYVGEMSDGSSQIRVMNSDGSNDHAVTSSIGDPPINLIPRWTPDGRRLFT